MRARPLRCAPAQRPGVVAFACRPSSGVEAGAAAAGCRLLASPIIHQRRPAVPPIVPLRVARWGPDMTFTGGRGPWDCGSQPRDNDEGATCPDRSSSSLAAPYSPGGACGRLASPDCACPMAESRSASCSAPGSRSQARDAYRWAAAACTAGFTSPSPVASALRCPIAASRSAGSPSSAQRSARARPALQARGVPAGVGDPAGHHRIQPADRFVKIVTCGGLIRYVHPAPIALGE